MFWLPRTKKHRISRPPQNASLKLESLDDRWLPSTSAGFVQTNLVSNIAGMAATQDPLLVNPWGVAFSGMSPFWVANNGSGTSTLYNGAGVPQPPGTNPPLMPLQVTIPNINGTTTPQGTPTGAVNNGSGGFTVSETVNGVTKSGSSVFLFATLDGGIFGWSPTVDRTHAILGAKVAGAVFTGLAIGTDSHGDTLIYAADHAHKTIDVFNSSFTQISTLPFTDANLPAGANPFNIQNVNGNLYVEYTVSGNATVHGAVDVFTTDGTVVPDKLITGGALNSPWGVTMAPAGFGQFSHDLLVGNFGDGHINAFDPNNGTFLGTLTLSNGQAFEEDHLWTLAFGNGTASSSNTLYFTAGIHNEHDGLFGSLQAVTSVAKNAPLLPALGTAAEQTVSTIPPPGTTPANADVNPYGAAFVPQGFEGTGVLQAGDLLVSNFNDSANAEGTGSTIIRITPDGQHTVFFQGPQGLGLTTALGVLKSGFVIVGSVPADSHGMPTQGSLMILDSNGKVVGTPLTDSALLNGPWDLAINDRGDFAQVFVSNVNTGTITRIDLSIPDGKTPTVLSETQIASGFTHGPDPTVFALGPTGLAFDARTDTLFVASTADNKIYAIRDASDTRRDHGTGKVIYSDPAHLRGPLGLVLAPNGDLIIANGDDINPPGMNQQNMLVEITQQGKFVSQFQLDPGAAGAAFGLAVENVNGVTKFAAVDDTTNTVHIFTLQQTPAVHHHHGDDHDGD
jgi:uncharacterized protein (TIGR03118 family)